LEELEKMKMLKLRGRIKLKTNMFVGWRGPM
jgi:hypothetical protein